MLLCFLMQKKMRIENKDEGIPITALREMCILKHLHHENVVDLYDNILK